MEPPAVLVAPGLDGLDCDVPVAVKFRTCGSLKQG